MGGGAAAAPPARGTPHCAHSRDCPAACHVRAVPGWRPPSPCAALGKGELVRRRSATRLLIRKRRERSSQDSADETQNCTHISSIPLLLLSDMMMSKLLLVACAVASAKLNAPKEEAPSVGLQSDDFVLHVAMYRHRRAETEARRLQPPPGGGGGPPPGGGGGPGGETTAGSTTSTACTSTTCKTTGDFGSYMDRSALTWDTATGLFGGFFVSNGCPNNIAAYEYGGVQDTTLQSATELAASEVCIKQTLPATTSTTTPFALSLRGIVGYSLTAGERIYGPADAGFTFGQVCTNSRGAAPSTAVEYGDALLERICGSANLLGGSPPHHWFMSASTLHALYAHVHTRASAFPARSHAAPPPASPQVTAEGTPRTTCTRTSSASMTQPRRATRKWWR